MAVRLPRTMDKAATVASTGNQPGANLRQAPLPSTPAKPVAMTLAKTKKLATFEPDAMRAALGVGAPSYASGAQRWKGTAAILKPNPMTVMTMAMITTGSIIRRDAPSGLVMIRTAFSPTPLAIPARLVEPLTPYSRLNPKSVKAAAMPPNKKYLMAASADFTVPLFNAVRM